MSYRARITASVAGVALVLASAPAWGAGPTAQPEPPAKNEAQPDDSHATDYRTPRYEPAGFPLLGGNSDIGFEFGGVVTLTRFEDDRRPYLWNMDMLVTASLKGAAGGGTDLAQQNYLWQWDLPGMLGGKVRLTPLVYYQKTINQAYFGLGNASSGARPEGATPRYFQYVDSELRARQLARIELGGPYQLVLAGTFRAESPEAYAGSRLEQDAKAKNADGTPLVRGVRPMGIGMLGAGGIYDTRDNEIYPHAGAFHQLGARVAGGMPTDAGVSYVGFGASLTWAYPLGRDTVLAARVIGDFLVGNVPFYDLFTGGPFQTYDLPGGPSGVRGVPIGRYLGRVKAVANVELRSLPLGFQALGQRFRVGGVAFADAGRAWLDTTFSSPLDGSGIGIKYGVGAGAYLLWGQAALFRLELAYSPDQVAENPGFPLAIYVEDGVMF